MKVDWLVVGAGYTGSVLAERIASQRGESVLVVDRRDTIAGNAYDHYDEHGVLVHRYGPHIFHTNSKKVWDYLSAFTKWRPYFHHVVAVVDGKKVPVPFNLNSLDALFPAGTAAALAERLVAQYGFGAKVPILKMRESPDPELRKLAEFVYQKVFLGYTVKQWGLRPEELDPSVTARVPVYVSRDDRYFQDTYQAIPSEGYTAMFGRILAHPKIKILLKTDFREIERSVQYDRMIYTGPLDEFFGCKHGALPYRSLRFDFKHVRTGPVQTVAQVNYPNEFDYTRTTEFRHIAGQEIHGSTIAYEYPEAHEAGRNEPYYPIPKAANRELYKKYADEAEALGPKVIFAGRLADYQYYNMDQAVARALQVFEKEIGLGPKTG